jgi:hypothetical protein
LVTLRKDIITYFKLSTYILKKRVIKKKRKSGAPKKGSPQNASGTLDFATNNSELQKQEVSSILWGMSKFMRKLNPARKKRCGGKLKHKFAMVVRQIGIEPTTSRTATGRSIH